MPPDQRTLLEYYLSLNAEDQDSLRAFAEFLVSRAEDKGECEEIPDEPVEPKFIPRPKKETVIGAIKRLSETYYMIDRNDLLTETSSLMSAHIMHGRIAPDVIDDLEALFVTHYNRRSADGN
ncbi:MAG: hypothetical protein GY792_18125 [Gammaproteobacteria bacterium]|nr:hypothetical protein [Gammaproteobacteria bacterium]